MTSWQDQPPLTRRQARENQRAAEREGSPAADGQSVSRRAATVAPTRAGEVPQVATPYSFASAQREVSPETGRRDGPPTRPRTPRYEELSFDSLLAASHAGGPANSAVPSDRATAPVVAPVSYTPPLPTAEAREVEPAASPAAPFGSATAAEPRERPAENPWSPPSAFSNERTNDAAPKPASAAHTPASGMAIAPDGHPLTRRELRAMQQAQAAAELSESSSPSAAVQQTAVGEARSVPFAPVVPAAPNDAALPTTSQPETARDAVSETAHRIVPPAAPASRGEDATPIRAVPASAAATAVASTPLPGGPSSTPAAGGGRSDGSSTGAANVPGPATDPQLRARAGGHWSTMDDDGGSATGVATPRSAVSTGTVTTANALILPSVPISGLSGSPLTSTGEVIVTGSIDLPRSLGATGQHPDHFDSSDIDRLFEETDAGPATSTVAPVRASKAVATHTSTRGMIAPPKARGNKLPVVLAVTAAFLALGVAALLVAGYVFHAF